MSAVLEAPVLPTYARYDVTFTRGEGSWLYGPDGTCEASLTSWTKGPSLMAKRDHHATFVADSSAGAFLYVLGGIQDNTNELATVEFAPLVPCGVRLLRRRRGQPRLGGGRLRRPLRVT